MRYAGYSGSVLCLLLLIIYVIAELRGLRQLLQAAQRLNGELVCETQLLSGDFLVNSPDNPIRHALSLLHNPSRVLPKLQQSFAGAACEPGGMYRQAQLAAIDTLHAEVLEEVERNLLQLLWVCALLLMAATALAGVPLAMQQRSTRYNIRESNRTLQRQAQELRAVHTTIGGMLEDIVQQRKRANRTSEINARLAAVINSADDAILSLNLAGYVTTANLAANRLLGRQCEGQRFVELFPADATSRLRTALMVAEEQNSGSTVDITLQRKQQRLDLSLTISLVFADDGQLSGYSVIAKDVTYSRLEEERFRLAVEAAPNAMIMIDSHGLIVLFNSEAERMFGYKRDELAGKPIDVLLPAALRPAHREQVQSFVAAPSRRQMGRGTEPLHGQRRSGEHFPIEVGLTPIQIDKETYVISSILDMSERIAQQKSLTDLNQELSRKNREMEQFIYTVSHDLKAPLVTIAGFANRLLHAKDLQLPVNHQHKLERIIVNVKAMDALLQDLLHLSRVIKRDLEKTQVDVGVSLDHVFSSLEGMIGKSQAYIDVRRPLAPVYAQESLLFQCLQNIISNAIKYASSGVTPRIKIESVQPDGYAGISISDNGIGIAEHHHQRIFNVFERLDPDACEGTGVGLSIVKTIMDKHNGKIELASTLGEGTTFTLLFPAA